MNAALLGALVLLLGALVPCLVVASRGDVAQRLVALALATPVTAAVLMLLAAGYERSSYLDLALVLALLAFAGSQVYARLVERFL